MDADQVHLYAGTNDVDASGPSGRSGDDELAEIAGPGDG